MSNLRRSLSLAVVACASLSACGGDWVDADPWEPQRPLARCGTGSGELPPGLTELSYDSGVALSDVSRESWNVGGEALAEAVLNEAVRFDLDRPAQLHGFSVQWAQLPSPDDPRAEIIAGLYPDFGLNGFDFWPYPLWNLSRCRGDIEAGAWTTYVLPEPLVVEHPGLIYVAHRRDGAGQPAFMFDDDYVPDGDCSGFDTCHSVMNLPFAEQGSYFNGVSFPIGFNFLVRLHLRYLEEVTPEETFFQPLPTVEPIANRHAFGDVDNDGDDDLLTGARLLRNDGGRFVQAAGAGGLSGATISGGVFGDYDNDGCLDLFAFAESTRAGDTLWRGNCDATFEETTLAAGIEDTQDYNLCQGDPEQDHQPSPAAAWLDLDNDGWLDLYVVDFICWSDETYYRDQVFHNDGDGTFTEWSGGRGFLLDALPGRVAAPIDVEQDGDVDLLVGNYRLRRNLFYENQGGTVVETGVARGLAGHRDMFGAYPYYGHTIGAAWGDLDNDGDFDLIEANLAHPRFFGFSDKTRVLINDGVGNFEDISGDWSEPTSAAGLRYQETHSVPVLGDFDHDGALDLAISAIYDGRPTDFYWGRGDGTFVLDAFHAGITVTNGWGMAVADFDQDGDLDLAATGALFENTREDEGRWLQVRAVGTERCNRGAYGATVRVEAGDSTRVRHVQGGSGQGSQDSPTLHFGLGELEQVDAIEVDFPGAGTVRFDGPFDVDQRLWLYEDGEALAGWGPP